VLENAALGAVRGLGTGAKSLVNSAASTVVNFATLGFKSYDGPLGVSEYDRAVGYDAASFLHRASGEIATSLLTAGASQLSRAGTATRIVSKTALAYDVTGNVVTAGRGGVNAYQEGLGVGNTVQIVGGGLGLGGNVLAGGRALREIAGDAGRVRVSFDPATVSAGGLGGVRISRNPAAAEAVELGHLRVTDKIGAGVVRPDAHHIFPQEHRAFFEARGIDVDRYLLPLDSGTHSALHYGAGGGWWNQEIIQRIQQVETSASRLATPREILNVGAHVRRDANLQNIKLLPVGK
jgi:hypothetical protein